MSSERFSFCLLRPVKGGLVAANIFLKVDGIAGESTDSKHKEWIELASFSWDISEIESVPGPGGTRVGKVKFSEFSVAMRTNKASPVLFVAAASGKHIKTAQVSVRRAVKDTIEYLKIKLTDVLVSSFAESAEGAQGEADETLGFSFGALEVQYTPQDPTGKAGAAVVGGWDVTKNVKI
ncbi:MAG: Hcp family type VI secretion system effector [Solirubrobacteraceae bacterium]